MDDHDPAWASPWRPPSRRARWGRGVVRLRRAVLRRRRLLAALLTAATVLTALRTVTPAAEPTVPVLVATRDLAPGTVVRSDDLAERARPPETVPDGVASDVVGRTIAAPVRRGEPITDVRLVGPSLTEGYPDLVALPVRVPDAGSVGLLTVGDRIDLLATDPSAGDARVLAASAPVLALPTPHEGDAAGGLTGRLVVVGVSRTAVEVVAAAAVRDYLTFTFAR